MAYGQPRYKGAGTGAVGTTALSVAIPTTVRVKSNLMVLCVAVKATTGTPTVNTPTNWSPVDSGIGQQSAGVGAQGTADRGPVIAAVFYKISDGTETGNVSVTFSSAVTSTQGIIVVYEKPYDMDWYTTGFFCGVGTDTTASSTAWSATASSSITLYPDWHVLAISAGNSDAYSFTSQSLTQTGLTISNGGEVYDIGTTNGLDQRLVVSRHSVTSGTSSSPNMVYTMTASGSTAYATTGVTLMLVIRTSKLSGILKRYNGSTWVRAEARRYDGSAWQTIDNNKTTTGKVLKLYTGSAFGTVSTLNLKGSISSYSFSSGGGSIAPSITNGHECVVSSSDTSWLTVSVNYSTYENFSCTISATINEAEEAARSGYINLIVDGVTVRQISITQAEGDPVSFSMSESQLLWDDTGTSCFASFNVTSNTPWYISNYDLWISPDTTSGSAGVTPIGFSVGSGTNTGSMTFKRLSDDSILDVIDCAQYSGACV